MKLLSSVLAAAALVALAQPVFAQRGPGAGIMFPWWDSPIARDLNLSEDQQAQIRKTVADYRSRLIDLRAAVEKAEIELGKIYDEDRIDQQRANEALERLNTARADMMRNVSQMSLKLRTILTAQQWRDLQQKRPRPGWERDPREAEGPGPGPGPRRMRRPRPDGEQRPPDQ